MPKFLFVSSLVALTACAALLPVGCACAPADTEPTLGTSRAALTAGSVVISQVFGGNEGAVMNQDFVELFNRSSQSVDLSGTSLQLATEGGDFGATAAAIVSLNGVTMPASSYLLIGLAKKTPSTAQNLITPDKTSTFDLGATGGKVAIANKTTALGCGSGVNCDAADIVDLVGWGAATQFEGTKISGLDAGKGAIRKGAGCTDTNNNANDFVQQAPNVDAVDATKTTMHNAATAPIASCTPRDAGVDSGTPIPVTDPDPGDDPGDVDAGGRDAGRAPVVAATGDDGCAVSAVGVADTSLLGLVFAAGAVVLGRRRRRA